MNKAKIEALTREEDFPWRLRCMMALADIQGGELEEKSGVPKRVIYRIRSGDLKSNQKIRERLVISIEMWRPGTIDMIRAAEVVGNGRK